MKVEMIKTLPLLTIPLLAATPSVVLSQGNSCTYHDRNEVLLIRLLPYEVAHREEAAHQIVIDTHTGIGTAGRHTATDLGRGPPNQLSVMSEPAPTLRHRAAVIKALFGDPALDHRAQCPGPRRSPRSNGLGIIFEVSRRVDHVVDRRQMIGPSLGVGG